jgi:hypothetical protein
MTPLAAAQPGRFLIPAIEAPIDLIGAILDGDTSGCVSRRS